jgi:hypothetical protein
MGRGRAKAKQTKVARELKYSSQGTDFEALQRELAGSNGSPGRETEVVDSTADSSGSDVDDEYDTEYDDYRDWATGKH